MADIDAELSDILDGGTPKDKEVDAAREQVEAWLKETGGNIPELLKKVIDNSPNDHLVLIRLKCGPAGHGAAEVYAANSGFAEMIEMFTDSLHQLVIGSRNITDDNIRLVSEIVGEEGEDDEDDEDDED